MPLYVITGGPCVGKTTLIEELRNKGYQILPEFARLIIEEGKYKPWINFSEFQQELVRRQKEAEFNINGSNVFCDRGLADSIAYQRIYGKNVNNNFIAECKGRYAKVFFLERLPVYEKDHTRREDPKTALKIHQEIEKAYTELGYDLIKVPDIGIEARIEKVLKEILNS